MQLFIIKLGGSIVSNKSVPFSFNEPATKKIGNALATFLKKNPETRILLGSGAGSFGHFTVKEVNYTGNENDLIRASKVRQSVIELNKKVVDTILQAGVPAYALQPSAFIRKKPQLEGSLDIIKTLLLKRAVPIVYGDIVLDSNHDTTVVPTEDLLNYIGFRLSKDKGFTCKALIYLTNVPGVLDNNNRLVKELGRKHTHNLTQINGYDTTGGMYQKVAAGFGASEFAEHVYIVDGNDPKKLLQALSLVNSGTELVA